MDYPKRLLRRKLEGIVVALSFVVSPGWKAAKDTRDQISPSLSLLPVVPHHITWRIDNHGDVSRHICFKAAEHPAQFLPHGVGSR